MAVVDAVVHAGVGRERLLTGPRGRIGHDVAGVGSMRGDREGERLAGMEVTDPVADRRRCCVVAHRAALGLALSLRLVLLTQLIDLHDDGLPPAFDTEARTRERRRAAHLIAWTSALTTAVVTDPDGGCSASCAAPSACSLTKAQPWCHNSFRRVCRCGGDDREQGDGYRLEPMTFVLIALGAGVAVSVELLEALAIVLAVAVSRRSSDALVGAAGAVVVCCVLGVVLGPVVLASVSLEALRITIGILLLLFGLEWLRKGTLRLAGRRRRSSSLAEYVETREELESAPLSPEGQADWAGRFVAFKGVLLEGIEVVVIVTALAARPSGPAPALAGAAAAVVVVLVAGAWLRKPLARIPETELKWGVGVLLSSFGAFFAAEGLGVHWPGGDAALLYLVAVLAGVSQAQSRWLAREARPA
jgi:uncharacterized membrane protein